MQRFIDEQICVICHTQEETIQFHNICRQYNIPFAQRWLFEQYLIESRYMDFPYVFIYNWSRGEKNEGISYWTSCVTGDDSRQVVDFDQLCIDFHDIPDILSLL